MLKALISEARLTLDITATGPILIKSGHATLSGPDMTPVLTLRNGQMQPYLPGSSLKGVVRSHLERVTRTLAPGVACNPFVRYSPDGADRDEASCGDVFRYRQQQAPVSAETAYAESCPICRLFGSLAFTGRLSLTDAYPVGTAAVAREERDGVGIDRLTGGAANRAKFNLEVVTVGAVFRTEIVLRNFECWQLGALLLLVADLEDGLIRIGSGRSRGLGAIRCAIAGEPAALAIHTIGMQPDKPSTQVWGLGKYLGNGSYDTDPEDILRLDDAPQEERKGLRSVATFRGAALHALRSQATADFVARLTRWDGRPALRGVQ